MPSTKGVLRRDPTAQTEIHRVDNRFVPVCLRDLLEALCEDEHRFGADAAALGEFAAGLRDVIDQEAAAVEHHISELYALFDPDRETLPQHDLRAARSKEAYRSLNDWLAYLLDKANFVELTGVQIEAAVKAASAHGFKVRIHPDRVTRLAIWVRGRGKRSFWRRTLAHPIAGETFRVEVYRRLVVVVQLKDDPHVIVKMFKDIPQADIEALLPHAEIEMNAFDRLMMLGGAGGAAGTTGMKVFGMLAQVVALSKLFWVLAVGLGTVAVRSFFGYRRARQTRDWQRTRHLYYQNLSNNASAIHRLIGMIAEEELKEAVLAYAFCRAIDDPVRDEVAFRTRIELFLRTRFNALVQFDVPDALETLTRLDLWTDRAAFEVVPPAVAIERLRRHWAGRQSCTYHADCVERGAAPLRLVQSG